MVMLRYTFAESLLYKVQITSYFLRSRVHVSLWRSCVKEDGFGRDGTHVMHRREVGLRE